MSEEGQNFNKLDWTSFFPSAGKSKEGQNFNKLDWTSFFPSSSKSEVSNEICLELS